MEKGSYAQFHAKLLGGFSLSYGGQVIPIDASPQTKYMQIMIRLLKAGSDGIERKALLEIIQPETHDQMKRMNNFRQQVFLLRQKIAGYQFPPGKYIQRRKSRYYFSFDYKVETDTGKLDLLLSRIWHDFGTGKERQALLWEFCQSYTGKFLPMLEGEEWATEESAYYQKWYFKCIGELCEILRKQEAYEVMLELCTTASQIHPYDEWQAVQIDCLLAMNRYEEAVRIYEQASRIYYEDLGSSALDRVMEKYRSRSSGIYCMSRVMNEIVNELKEQGDAHGAYGCSYPSFLDLYHVIARMGVKRGMENLLLLCTLTRKGTETALARKDLRQTMNQFQQVLAQGLRKGDAYTRYSENQFLVLLIGVQERAAAGIAESLKQGWERINTQTDTAVLFELQKAEGPNSEEDKDEKKEYIYGSDCKQ